MVTFARRFGLKIAARGQGHQPFGQAQVSGGIVIDMRSLQQVHTFTADSVEVDAGVELARAHAGDAELRPRAAGRHEISRSDRRRHSGDRRRRH